MVQFALSVKTFPILFPKSSSPVSKIGINELWITWFKESKFLIELWSDDINSQLEKNADVFHVFLDRMRERKGADETAMPSEEKEAAAAVYKGAQCF